MARQLRLEFPGALFHITVRGNEKRPIFRDDRDRYAFLEFLGTAVTRYGWTLSAYVLMLNHFHLLIQLTANTLSRGMHWLNTNYPIYFNKRHHRVGHLYQGRFKAFLIEKETYYLEVLRYVVLNPVRAQIVTTPEEFEWSSHRAVMGAIPAPEWLAVDDVLAQFGGDRAVARARYRAFVDAGIGLDRTPFADLIANMYLGSEAWAATIREQIELKPRADEHPRLQRQFGQRTMADVVAAVAQTLAVTAGDVRERGAARSIAVWLGRNEALLTNAEIAAGLRLRSSGYVADLAHRAESKVAVDRGMQAWIDQCVSTLRGQQRETKV